MFKITAEGTFDEVLDKLAKIKVSDTIIEDDYLLSVIVEDKIIDEENKDESPKYIPTTRFIYMRDLLSPSKESLGYIEAYVLSEKMKYMPRLVSG